LPSRFFLGCTTSTDGGLDLEPQLNRLRHI
jgi:hypothetical protein